MARPGVGTWQQRTWAIVVGGVLTASASFAQAPSTAALGSASTGSASASASTGGQTPPASAAARRDLGTLRIKVVDSTGATLANADVRVTNAAGVEDARTTNERGEALFEGLTPGRYALHIQTAGFEPFTLADLNVKRGQTNKEIELELGKFVEQVEVTRDETEKALNDAFAQTLSQEEIDQLPDDPDEMAEVLSQMAGPGAVMRVNGFSGGRLPPKSQIANIRFRFDPYSADNHESGFPRVDIDTKPGNGEWRNSMSFTFRDDGLNARNAFSPVRGDAQSRRYNWSIDGPLKKGRTSFSLNVGGMNASDTQTILVANEDGSFSNGLVDQPNDRLNIEARLEHLLTKSHIFRAEFERNGNTQENLGVGEFDLPERAYTRENTSGSVRLSESGKFIGKSRHEFRVEVSWQDTVSDSLSFARTINVQNAFTRGGAQLSGGRRTREVEIEEVVDFSKGIHSMRTGFEIEGGRYRSDERRNAEGTFTFASLADFEAGRPTQFSVREGNPLVEYSYYEIAGYFHDDMRIRKNLMVSAGLRYETQTHLDDRLNFAPRLHATWSPFKSGRTTVRAGFGIFYNWYESSLYEQTLRLDGVRQRDTIVRNPGYPDPFDGGASASVLPPSVIREAGDLNMPALRRFSVGMEQRMFPWLTVRANYFNQRGWDELRSLNANAPVNSIRPNPDLGNISEFDSLGRSKSQGIDVGLNFSYQPKRIFGAINYTLGEAFNDGDSATSLPVNGRDITAEWAHSRGDVRHRLFATINTPLIFGFRTSLNGRYQTASPYNITTGRDDNGDAVINDRPAGVGRNTARGAAQFNVDWRLSWSKSIGQRNTPPGGPGPQGGTVIIMRPPDGGGGRDGGGGGGRGGGGGGFGRMGGGENGRVNFELFAQVNNLFNRVNFQSYSGVLTSPFFGNPTSASIPRRVELGMRFGF